jgi:type IV pilus assembly protein PilW
MALPFIVRARQRGASLVETMVGILIGMIVIAVVYNILSVAESYKRATVGSSDAQITGLLTQFMASRDISNGGNGIMMSTTQMNTGNVPVPADLSNCVNNGAGAALSGIPIDALDNAARPIPVVITSGAGAGVSDNFISLSAGAAHVIWPVDVVFDAAAPSVLPGAPITVQSPNGFTVPPPTPAAPHWAVAIGNNPPNNNCQVIRVVGAVPDPAPPLPALPTGKVTLTQDPALGTAFALAPNADPPRVLNLGPQGLATRVRYDLDQPNAVLRTTDLLTVNAPVPVPIAQNVVLLKAQYGVDTDANGIIDCWTPADASTCGDFTPAAVRAFTLAQINRILAVRIGVVVRSDEPDLRALTDPGNADLQAEARALRAATRPPVVLFNCSTNNAACQNRVVVPAAAGVPVGSSSCGASVICDYWRYRTYETIVPLRNTIFAATIP